MESKKNYICILLSIIVNNFGDVLFDLFIVWKITENSNNILNAVYLVGSSILFRAVLALFIGILVDRKNKKHMIILSNVSSAIIILVFAISYRYTLNNLWLGLFFILLNDINNEIFSRSSLLLASELFRQDVFIKFQAKYTIINRIVIIAGSSMVGFLMTYVSDMIIFMLDIVTFIISAVSMLIIKYAYKSFPKNKETISHIVKSVAADLKYMFSSMLSNSFIIMFIIIMFILNLAYGYIPYILPVKIANEISSATLLGFIKSAISIGEIIGLLLVTNKGQYVSLLFKISMLGNAICMLILMIVKNNFCIILIFALYGMLDSITQPLFSYTITMLDEKNRGKILGGIDTVILLSPSLGMYVVTKLMNFNEYIGYLSLTAIFLIVFVIIKFSNELNDITV